VDISQTEEYMLNNFDITSLKIGPGIILNYGYYTQEIQYKS